ncbi:MAG: response regulator transcription factor [Saprospiraceae bacterium]|nr:response regulator transcription factor [Saprospiraceae bacterium]
MPVKIAIVDDHTMMVQAIANLLNARDEFKVIFTCRNGRELTEKLTVLDQLPDLVLLDINMPLMNGWETAEWIQKNYPQMRILCLTMNDDEMSVIKMFKSGAKGYVLKDAEEDELFLAIHSVMTKGFYYSDYVAKVMIDSFKSEGIPGDSQMMSPLKEREIEFLVLCCTELNYKQIADLMHLSPKTIDGYRDDLFQKLHVRSRIGLVLHAIKHGLVQP